MRWWGTGTGDQAIGVGLPSHQKKEEERKMKNLGYANGWTETPTEVKKCEELGHRTWSRNVGRCNTEHGCDECGYTYKVDSSD